jgi:HK97 gp10 family phage protein
MARFLVEVDGLTGVTDTIHEIPETMREVIADTFEEAAPMMEREAEIRAPIDEGDLLRSIGNRIRSDGLQFVVYAGADHAVFVEFGTEDTPAQAFLQPAYRRGARWIRQKMKTWGTVLGMKVRFRTKRSSRRAIKRPRA